jgi:hypothetical protein
MQEDQPLKIIMNRAEALFRSTNMGDDKFEPATLEIRQDTDGEHGFSVGLIVTADRRDMQSDDGNVVHLKAAWFTPQEFSQWLGQLVSVAVLLGLTDFDGRG